MLFYIIITIIIIIICNITFIYVDSSYVANYLQTYINNLNVFKKIKQLQNSRLRYNFFYFWFSKSENLVVILTRPFFAY